MSILIPVIYRNMKYPPPIKANMHEVSGNFHKEYFFIDTPYSLHTDSAYGSVEFCSYIVTNLAHIKNAQENNIPLLWYNDKWAYDFFKFIKRLIGTNVKPDAPPNTKPKAPDVLEIHPPFNNYCKSFDQFMDIFKVFYYQFKERYPATNILIENRFGSRFTGGKFLLSTCSDILEFCEVLSKENIDLRIVLDYPQLFSAEVKKKNKKEENWMGSNPLELLEKIMDFNKKIEKHTELIGGFHMWGKLKNEGGRGWKSHAGNLASFFSNDNTLKRKFLNSVFSTFNDERTRYFVPEVMSGTKDFHSIVEDMKSVGFTFANDNSQDN